MAHQSSGRQPRMEETASDIAGPLKTVLTKMDTIQKQQGRSMNGLCLVTNMNRLERNLRMAKRKVYRNKLLGDSCQPKKNRHTLRTC